MENSEWLENNWFESFGFIRFLSYRSSFNFFLTVGLLHIAGYKMSGTFCALTVLVVLALSINKIYGQ